jgi:hypothetical protein
MNARHLLVSTLVLTATVAHGAAPYKIPARQDAQAKQYVVYARVADHGFGVQFWHDNTATNVGSYAGLAGLALGSVVDAVKSKHPTSRAQDDAEKIAPLMDRAVAQKDLENALGEALPGVPLFAGPAEVKELGADAQAAAGAFEEDPVLVVELYGTLTANYQALQTTAIVRGFSRSQLAYRNRFDYVSDLLPQPHIKTKDEIESDVEAVKAKYRARKLTQAEKLQYNQELRAAAAGTTTDIWFETLLPQWLADNGSPLRQAFHEGIAGVVPLLAKDLPDIAPAEVRSVEQMRRRLPLNTAGNRYVSVQVGGPFAGSMMSEPEGLNATYCQGVAFRESKQQLPKLCP